MMIATPTNLYQIGESVDILAGEYAGLGGHVIAIYPDGCEVLVGGYQLPVAITDLAPDLWTVAVEMLDFLNALHGYDDDPARHRLITRLRAALMQQPDDEYHARGDEHEQR
jgi:hypothetical protein